jgi:hypothetical protein
MNTISVIAPIALKEIKLPDWRQSDIDVTPIVRINFMVKSFIKNFNQKNLAIFLIVCRDQEKEDIEVILKKITDDNRYKVMAESDYFNLVGIESSKLIEMPGWYIQQIIKLYFSYLCNTDFYLTMDSDILTFKKIDINKFFPKKNKALIGIESADDYFKIYTEKFAHIELKIKSSRYYIVEKLLKYSRPAYLKKRFYSETPVIMNKNQLINLFQHLRDIHQDDFPNILFKTKGWTEYGLYFLYLEMNNLVEKYHILGDLNSVLALEASVWQATNNYKNTRFYNNEHFEQMNLKNYGPFIAIQSWINIPDWLPKNYQNICIFYEYINNIIFKKNVKDLILQKINWILVRNKPRIGGKS